MDRGSSATLYTSTEAKPATRWARFCRWLGVEFLHLLFRYTVAVLCVVVVLSCILLLLTAVPLPDTPDGEDYLRSAAYLSLRWKIENRSPPPPSPPFGIGE